MSIGPTPPQAGPMLSPDGKWVWDGTQWRPIAHHETLFPSWQSITVEPAAPAAEAVRVAAPAPVLTQPVDLSLAYPSIPQTAPAWRQREPRATGANYYLYFIAGIVGIVIVLVVLNSVFPLWLLLPGPKASDAPTATQSPPPPVAHRSDFARADHFVSGVLPPSLADMNQVLQPVGLSCGKALTISCQDNIDAAAPKVKSVLSVIDHNPVPLCIAAPVAKLRADLAGVDAALQGASKAYADNKSSELAAAMALYSRSAAPLASDVRALTSTMKAQCNTQVLGP